MARQWADGYGARWYLHRDGTPPRDDDNDYYWTGVQWALLFDEDEDEKDDSGRVHSSLPGQRV
jgi:hypothetical protein